MVTASQQKICVYDFIDMVLEMFCAPLETGLVTGT